ncbi:MAG: transposase [Sulfurimonas sp.]|uniref:transposase n=1 Tax=Sulfurimonas sp. TaxID=2022749 RepID=UPI003D0F6B0A
MKIIECFCNDLNINEVSKKLDINYVTAKKRYDLFRQFIASRLEDEFKDKTVIEYDEYIYLEKSKKDIKENIFDAQNFLTFHYENKIYNLLMQNLNMYKNQFMDDGADEAYFKEFSKYMMFNKISKIQKKENLITKFWIFFENSILKYKGVRHENFFYYLKEIEFKFNYSKEVQKEILTDLYQNSL